MITSMSLFSVHGPCKEPSHSTGFQWSSGNFMVTQQRRASLGRTGFQNRVCHCLPKALPPLNTEEFISCTLQGRRATVLVFMLLWMGNHGQRLKPGHQHCISLVDHTECKSFAASKTSWILCKVTHLDLCSFPVLGLDALTRGFFTSSCCESGMLNHALNFELWSFSSRMVCGMILAGSQSQYHEWNKLKHLIMDWRDRMRRVLQR